jgi:hypothetical protein
VVYNLVGSWPEAAEGGRGLPIKHDFADQAYLEALIHCPAGGTLLEEVYITQGIETEKA